MNKYKPINRNFYLLQDDSTNESTLNISEKN